MVVGEEADFVFFNVCRIVSFIGYGDDVSIGSNGERRRNEINRYVGLELNIL